jgi:hypothetical protein
VPESLKNVLLVMAAQGVLVQPRFGGSEFWDVTWQKLGRVLPNLRSELFPEDISNSRDQVSKTADTEKEVQAEH